jgi:hypothetical protein
MRSLLARADGKYIHCQIILFPSQRTGKIEQQMAQRRYIWILIFLTLFYGCAHVPMSSDTIINDKLQAIKPLEQGDVLVVYGENATVPEQSITNSYFTSGCLATFQGDTVGELIKTILKENPLPGRFAVRHLKDLEKEEGSDPAATGGGSILSRLNLSKNKVLMDHLRYAIHVNETFEIKIHIPLYAIPFGIASCGNRTVLEANIYELPTEKFVGSFTVSSEGEFTVFAYMFHLVVFRDTQKDAMERLSREIVERLTGMKPLENEVD